MTFSTQSFHGAVRRHRRFFRRRCLRSLKPTFVYSTNDGAPLKTNFTIFFYKKSIFINSYIYMNNALLLSPPHVI